MNEWIGKTLDRYEITQYLGEGDFGAVFKSYDSVLQRDVALRVMKSEFAKDPNLRERFLNIARTAAQLDHPGIVQVHDFGQDQGVLYLVMEYVPGINLSIVLQSLEQQNQWIRLKEALGIALQVSHALDYAHAKGVFQLDIRPHNLLLQTISGTLFDNTVGLPYQVVIADLGLARIPAPEEGAERPPSIYASPEQVQRENTDKRSDVYSLGILLYELSVGSLDYSRETLQQPLTMWENIPESINKVIQKSIHPDPSERYASAEVFARNLRKLSHEIADFRGVPPGVIKTVSLKEFISDAAQEATIRPTRHPNNLGEKGSFELENGGPAPSKVELFVDTIHLSVEPGSQVTVRYSIRNHGGEINNYRIVIEKIPNEWLPSPPPRIQLVGGQSKEMKLTIHPPKSPRTSPGRYPVVIRVTSQDDPDISDQAELILTVGVYNQFSSILAPKQVFGDQSFRVIINNKGNARESFNIYLSDQSGELAFRPSQERISLEAGEEQAVVFRTIPRTRRLFGDNQEYFYTANVTSSQGEIQSHQGTAVHKGTLPIIVLPVSLITLFCVVLVGVFIYFRTFAPVPVLEQAAETQTQVAATTQAALAMANEATLQAATATAAWLQADSDNDGLINSDELLYGSDPNIIDSDGDTLPDGVEVHQLDCPSPVNPDTDGDGLNDNVDQDLCNRATATPPPILTPVPPSQTLSPSTDNPVQTTPTEPVLVATPTPIGDNGVITFSSNRDGNYEIYLMLSNGSLQTRITNDPSADTDPVLSPSREQVVFVSNRDGNRQIFSMNTDGTNLLRLSNNEFEDYSPAWSPDGTQIIFISNRDGNPEIYLMNADGSQQVRILETSASEDNPSWSPDGGRIIFDSDQNGSREIYTISIDGTGMLAITDNGFTNYDPAYSGSGYRIALVSDVDGKFDVHIMNSDGSGRTRLTDLQATPFEPDWSQDELWISFVARVQDSGEIYIINADGSQLTNLTNNTADDIGPSW